MPLTSLSDPQDVIKGLQAGADNFLTKPYEDNFLVSCIKNIFANQELRKNQISGSEIEIIFAGQKYFINSDRMQIIHLLLSTYENAVQKNNELHKAHNDLIDAHRQLEQKNIELEKVNQEKTHFLSVAAHDPPQSSHNNLHNRRSYHRRIERKDKQRSDRTPRDDQTIKQIYA